MKRTILLFSTLLFSVVILCAQTSEKGYPNRTGLTNEDFFTKSDLVVESSYIGLVATYDIEGNKRLDDIYSIAAIKIHKVYKGDKSLEGDTVYIVGKASALGIENTYWRDTYWRDHIANLKEGEIAIEPIEEILYAFPSILKHNDCRNCYFHDDAPHIHFFRLSDFPDIQNPKISPYIKYKFLYSSETKLYVCDDKILGLNNLVFQNRGEFYDYIKQFEGFIVPERTSLPEEQFEKAVPKEIVIDSLQYEIQRYNEVPMDFIHPEMMKEQSKDSKKKIRKKLKNSRQDNNITFQIDNSSSIPIEYGTPSCLPYVMVTDANGCQAEALASGGKKSFTSQEGNNFVNNKITLFPNPTSGSFTVSNISNATVYVYTALSSLVRTFEHVSYSETMNIGHLPTGIYFIKIVEGNIIKNEKLILSK